MNICFAETIINLFGQLSEANINIHTVAYLNIAFYLNTEAQRHGEK